MHDRLGVAKLQGVTDQELDPAAVTVGGFFSRLVSDADAAASRESFCEAATEAMKDVAVWLTLDSLFEAGDIADVSAQEHQAPDPSRVRSFNAVALVAQIACDLMTGTRALLKSDNVYSAAALVRQLVECEYLFRRFGLEFASAEQWLMAETPDEKWAFSPKKLRRIGGFDDKEYERHCNSGGHPTPTARTLLDVPRKLDRIAATAGGKKPALTNADLLWPDFTFHCDRAWRAVADLLSAEHARFRDVRSHTVAKVDDARISWQATDALGQHAPALLTMLEVDPGMLLKDLIAASG